LSAPRSWFGAFLAVIYLVGAGYLAWDDVHNKSGGFITLRGMMTTIATAPSQATFGVLFGNLGVPRINYPEPGPLGVAQLLFHLLVTASVVYLVGFGLEWLVRWLVSRF
jgi:hypothetical protein